MTENEYFWAWAYYAGGASLFFIVFWYWTRNFLWAEARHLLRLILAVILAVPWYTDANQGYLSPAWLISGADALLHGQDAFWRAGKPLVVVLVSVIFISTLVSLVRWYMQRSRVSA